MSDKDGGPAFPVTWEHDGQMVAEGGMTLRDYFAAKALQGLLSNAGGPIQASDMSGWRFVNCEQEDVIKLAYGCADMMLEARKS